MDKEKYLGLDCVRLANSSLSLLITSKLGPRIIALQVSGGRNLFAEIPDFKLECPGHGYLRLWGGHRLWHAPEMAKRTYLPDDLPPEIVEMQDGLRITQPLEVQTGIQKKLEVTLPDDSATIIVDHYLQNQGTWPVTLAPWAITQLKPGGFAILPQRQGASDPDGLLPNRQLSLWPYTDVRSPHLRWGNDFIFVQATMTNGALKVGFPNPIGWLAYFVDNTLFVKEAAYDPAAIYFDHGSSSECYCNDRFIELETLGPRTIIAPDETTRHREVWRLFTGVSLSPEEVRTTELVKELALNSPSPYLS